MKVNLITQTAKKMPMGERNENQKIQQNKHVHEILNSYVKTGV
jgi:hypothetical protein